MSPTHPYSIAHFFLGIGALTLAASAMTIAPIHAATQPVHTGVTTAGKVLVDSRSKTLYVFSADTAGKSRCQGACAQYWPPALIAATPVGHSSDVKAKLGTIKRADGTSQLTLNGLPAYTYVGDKSVGDSTGQGLSLSGGLWWVINPTGSVVKVTQPTVAKNGSQPPPNSGPTETTPYSYY